MPINLLDVVKHYKGFVHQDDALNWLQQQLSKETLETFAEKYRTESVAKTTSSNTWEGVLKTAKQCGAKFPEVVAAQWALESAWGQSTSGKNNFFGLKGSGSNINTTEFINNQWISIKAGFIDFPDLTTCIQYLVDRWYKDFGTYKGVNRAGNRNECAKLLVEEKYATDPAYATKLIQIMDRKIGTTTEVTDKNDPIIAAQPFTPQSPFSYKVTPNITYGEIALNQERRRFIKQYQCETAIKLCRFLEKVRAEFGNKPLIITSGYRPFLINKEMGGASNSEHLFNTENTGAIDFYIKGADIYEVQKYCDKTWEYSVGYGAPKGFVHLGIRNTKQKIRWNY